MELAIDSSTVDVARRAQDGGHLIGFLKPMPPALADAHSLALDSVMGWTSEAGSYQPGEGCLVRSAPNSATAPVPFNPGHHNHRVFGLICVIMIVICLMLFMDHREEDNVSKAGRKMSL
ncbi:hypothetical protein CABS01_08357 [Colletotrichum abscissum]|uniref:Uncharacterized protein n=2 Tax=Colletotrichum acutatum species complex TaxID=2707335 RepID=A0A9Q8SEX8_9PEZI|nr:uncharacterized protein CLUP02_17238 [Colletotrichum lupini]XP_060305738.1 uncharacterized protein CCOS01_15455 [Colletotrichum costaricense]XP_060401874.1 uncharacterized protein CABS01_08357 [Colletotrichum abscissum]KAI3549530.1 hypothetical protein CSPX01_02181 [Colletotrichum filicis]KAK1507177.1 hypothetical protein CABS01_08357 [Colletotrichum abscissum]KAK1509361.1 hypothetical protein CCOS01_15455 [Colletotrichum costaricense]UQC75730.1 hypothetical protein CLUP02_17238 [Colletotr